MYRTIRYAVDPSTGTVGNSLSDNSWFDQTGHLIKQLPAGSSRFTKISYDSLGRATVRYSGYDLDETSYSEASSVTDDTIMEQSETAFDNAGNAIQQTVRQRYHNAAASQLGAAAESVDHTQSPRDVCRHVSGCTRPHRRVGKLRDEWRHRPVTVIHDPDKI